MFKPKSGMVFETTEGRRGVFIEVEDTLYMYYGTYPVFEQGYDKWDPMRINSNPIPNRTLLSKIWTAAPHNFSPKDLVWERKSNSVKLNDEYTAVLDGETVIVGCQKIPLS